jgi:hypothetical protein
MVTIGRRPLTVSIIGTALCWNPILRHLTFFRSFARATTLADGHVLVVGGYDRNIRLHPDAYLITIDGRRIPAA